MLDLLRELIASIEAAPTSAQRVDQLDELERLKSAVAAVQVRITDLLDQDDSLTSDRSKGAQVGLARHESPHRGQQLLETARALVHDLPETLAALERGDLNERRAQIIATETRDLALADRRTVDARIATELPGLGDRDLQLLAQRAVLHVDEAGAVRRRERAHARRHLTGRRLPNGLAQITATISEVHHAAIMTSLHLRAATERAIGHDTRSRSQIVADLFVERLTGQPLATAAPVTVNLVLSAETLLGGDDEPAEIAGVGPIPASVARNLVRASPEQTTRIRRLFRLDHTDRLVAMESTSRRVNGLLRTFITIRDQTCRTPWCNGTIRHLDHITRRTDHGPTSEPNSQGLCEACNYLKEEPGWRHRTTSGDLDQHVVETTTPTGHRYQSRAPAPPRGTRPRYVPTQPGRWTLTA